MAEEEKLRVMEKLNRNIEPKEYFRCCNGLVVKSIQELPNILEKADNQQFYSHITDSKNDLAKWIYDVFGLEELASLLGPVKSKEETIRIIRAYLAANSEENSDISPEEKKNKLPIKEKKEEDKFADVANLSTSSSALPKTSEEKLSKRLLDLINKLEEKVENKITKKPMPLPPKELPILKPSEPKTDATEDNSPAKNKKFVLPDIRNKERTDISEEKKDLSDDRIRQIEERLKKETESGQQIMAEAKLPVQKADIEMKENMSDEPKPEIKPMPVKIEIKENDSDKINEPDRYFEKNPVTLTQFVEAKKQTLQIEKLKRISYSGNELAKELTEIFKDNYGKAYQFMVSMRKAGFDTAIAEVMMARIPSKIKIFEASQEEKDSVPVKRYLNEAIEELNNLK